jgi:hypothetical protein
MSAQFNSYTGHTLAEYTQDDHSGIALPYCTDYVHPSYEKGIKMWGDAIWRGFVGLTHMT